VWTLLRSKTGKLRPANYREGRSILGSCESSCAVIDVFETVINVSLGFVRAEIEMLVATIHNF
jgi:hypothetical protein